MDVSLSELWEWVMAREAWRAVIHGVAKSRTWLSDWTELNWNSREEHSSIHQQKIGLKIYWAWPHPSEQDSVFPSVSLFHQEASKASYPSLSEGRQSESHHHRRLTSLITWTTALSNSMKLWAMPCRATQEGRVMVESSDKTWSTGEGNAKPLQPLPWEPHEQYEEYSRRCNSCVWKIWVKHNWRQNILAGTLKISNEKEESGDKK